MKNRLRNLLVALLLTASTGHLLATTFVVSDLGDSGAGTLRQAILDANANAGDDAITFSVNGIITLTTHLPAITGSTAIVGPGTNALFISGVKYRIFNFSGGNSNSISDLSLGDTRVGADGHVFTNAVGIVSDGPLNLMRCLLRNCQSDTSRGGAILSSNLLEMRGCVLTNCGSTGPGGALDVYGGGIYTAGGIARLRDCTIVRCGASGNALGGGGINGTAGSLIHLINTRIANCANNYVADGGAIDSYGDMILENCVLANNGAYWGGAIVGRGQSSLRMTNTILSGNSAFGGGAIYGVKSGWFVGCTIYSNRCSDSYGGAGIWSYGNLALDNCTLSRNIASAVAGNPPPSAIRMSAGSLSLNHCTVVSNSGPYEIAATNTFTSQNSIIGSFSGSLNSGGQNLIVITNGMPVNNGPGDLLGVDPHLGPLQNNGGPTWPHALLPGSTAIDNATPGGLLTDQRGAPRPPTADIGAYEVVTVTPPNLQIALTDPTHVTLSWLSAPGPVVLQQNAGFANGGWSDVGTTPTDNGTTTSLTLTPTGDGKFYRLRSP